MRRFAQVLDDLKLVDLPLQGGYFTWSGGLHNQAWARLDKFLVSPSWLDQFSNVIQKRLPRPISDHFLILIEGGGIRRGLSPSRFENMWLKVEGFKDLMRSWWQEMSVSGRASYKLATKLKLSRELWLREGDRNTGYFHRMANAHRRRNTMDRIKVSGVWLSKEQEISQQEADTLELPFMEKEVHLALMDMNGDKAPGEAEELGDFRPISLLGGLYKLLAKVLANRIKNVIVKVVSPYQNAFVMGSSKGLRQGDPLSPYLFVMGMEVLSALIRRAVEGGFISGCNIRRVGEVEEILEMAVELGCKVGQLPSTYLGLPLGGRITIIKSTLASMSLYQLSLFRMLRIVARRLKKLQRDFLWGGGSMERKAHLVNWERVCEEGEGGLGLRKLVPLNKALLGKWVWRFARAKDEMWKQVLMAKYGQEEFGWRTKKANGAFGVWGLKGNSKGI
ncbi:putative ribonuclease H protein [Vitis vinifera]|uniref:Putative ribonuclease H protein n=1 Tax=Vitis vinifera TaxID=29760 RepID=A0A438IFZ9_VITVI|nr:putative ribonuclease H protein [Vitis vinifera]